MKGKLVLLATVGLLGVTQAQKINVYAAPYITFIDYEGSGIKKDGWVGTLLTTLSFDAGKQVVNLGYAYTHLNYKVPGSWNQNDYTVSYTTYNYYPWILTVGYHYLTSPGNDFSAKANIPFAYFGYSQRYQWDLGTFVSYSDYKQGVGAFELQPSFGFYRWKDYYTGSYYSINLTWINVKGMKTLQTNKRNYFSVGGSATYFRIGSYSVKAGAWLGQRMLMVDNGGFVVYNLRERYSFGADLSGTYYLDKNLSLTGIVGYSHYKETSTGKKVDVYTFTVSVGYSF